MKSNIIIYPIKNKSGLIHVTSNWFKRKSQ